MSTSLFGWDLLVRSVEQEIKTNQDVLVCFTHLVLINNGFKCIGLGESKNFDGTEPKSEALPPGWSESYSIRYVLQGRLYILKCTKVDDGLLVNLLRTDERTTSGTQLNSNLVASRTGAMEEMLPKHVEMLDLIKTQLIDKVVLSTKSRDMSSQTDTSQRDLPSSAYPNPRPGSAFDPIDPLRVNHPPTRPLNVGEIDLDPFAGRNPLGGMVPPMGGIGGGGGMLFNPPMGPRYPGGAHGLPPGAVPPGSRFDPFRPPDVDQFPPRRPNHRPDNDEFPPPGYDDMFM